MTDQHEAERRRNKAMGDWIRQGISAPNMPLELPRRLDEPDALDVATGAPSPPRRPPSADAGAGTSNAGRSGAEPPSMNEQLRTVLRSRPPGRRGG